MKNIILIAIVIAFITSLESCSESGQSNRVITRYERINAMREVVNINYNLLPYPTLAETNFHNEQIYKIDSLMNVELLSKINSK